MTKKQEEWISAPHAIQIISEKSGRPIQPGYLHLLVKYGKIERRPVDGRTFEYKKSDVEKVYVYRRGEKRNRDANSPS